MRQLLIICSLVFCVTAVTAQDIVFSNHMFYKGNINPATFINSNEINAFVLYNSNFGGFNDHPHTTVADVSYVHDNFYKLGLFVVNDVLGYDKIQNIKLRFSKKFQIDNGSYFTLGMAAGVFHRRLEITKLQFELPNDPLSYTDYSRTLFDVDIGAEYHRDNWDGGISITHLRKVFDSSENEVLTGHLYGYAQYKWEYDNTFTFFPNILMRYWKGSYFADLGATGFFKNEYWAGLAFNTLQDLTVSAGAKVHSNIMFGYAFKTNFNQKILNPFKSSTHEIFLSFSFEKGYKSIKTPRFID